LPLTSVFSARGFRGDALYKLMIDIDIDTDLFDIYNNYSHAVVTCKNFEF